MPFVERAPAENVEAEVDLRRRPDGYHDVETVLHRIDWADTVTALRRKDGLTFPVEVNIRLLRFSGYDRFMSTSRNITKRKEVERKLERENERLDRFASVLSHDLRNPLNVAQGRLQLAQEQLPKEASGEVEVHLSSVDGALGRMDEIIEDLLLLTWSEREIDPEDLGLVKLQAAAREAWNSVEHGGAAVSVAAGSLPEEQSQMAFFAEDDGPGIPEEKREKVMAGGYSFREEGTGRGLSTVQGIAGAHEWSVSVAESVTEGRESGARFEVQSTEAPGG